MHPAVPRCLIVLGFGLWLAALWPVSYWMSRDADSRRASDRLAIDLCREDLALRAVAVRRYAARTGRLPENLGDCAVDLPSLTEWADRSRGGRTSIAEPWQEYEAAYLESAGLPPVPVPDIGLDLFGLPVVYVRGDDAGSGETWVRSDDPVPQSVREFLHDRGGEPARSPEPFALSSIVLQNRVARRSANLVKMILAWVLFFGALVALIAAAVFVARRWAGRQSGPRGQAAITITTIISTMAAIVGFFGSQATCYTGVRFTSRFISKEDRREILSDAVDRGDLDPTVADRARRHIEKLPE